MRKEMASLYFGYPDGSSYKFDDGLLSNKISFEHGVIPRYMENFAIPLSCKAEIKAECELNVPLFEKFFGVDLAGSRGVESLGLILGMPYEEQIRRHKKRRINKKWAKRYGYRTKFREIIIDEFKCVKHSEQDVELVGRCDASKFITGRG